MPRGWNYYLRAKTMEPSVPRKYEQCVKITWHINNYSSSSSSSPLSRIIINIFHNSVKK